MEMFRSVTFKFLARNGELLETTINFYNYCAVAIALDLDESFVENFGLLMKASFCKKSQRLPGKWVLYRPHYSIVKELICGIAGGLILCDNAAPEASIEPTECSIVFPELPDPPKDDCFRADPSVLVPVKLAELLELDSTKTYREQDVLDRVYAYLEDAGKILHDVYTKDKLLWEAAPELRSRSVSQIDFFKAICKAHPRRGPVGEPLRKILRLSSTVSHSQYEVCALARRYMLERARHRTDLPILQAFLDSSRFHGSRRPDS